MSHFISFNCVDTLTTLLRYLCCLYIWVRKCVYTYRSNCVIELNTHAPLAIIIFIFLFRVLLHTSTFLYIQTHTNTSYFSFNFARIYTFPMSFSIKCSPYSVQNVSILYATHNFNKLLIMRFSRSIESVFIVSRECDMC